MRTQPRNADVVCRVLALPALIGVLLVIGCGTYSSSGPPVTYTLGGTVSGLKGSGLVLVANGSNNLAVSANGAFAFTTALASGTAYSVTVLTQPANPNQICSVMSGSGTVTNAAINTVAVICVTTTTALIVADSINNRVLIYNAPFSTGQSANVVWGQSNFTTATFGMTANTMNQPATITEDSAGNLYVADQLNCRVTQFLPPFITGMSASVVFGQPNLITGNCPASAGISASSLGNSTSVADQVLGMTFASSGALWVADSGSNRVLVYQPPFSNGMAATLAIGQANLTSGLPNQGLASATSASLFDPGFFVFDSSGNIWIPDPLNNRILEFKSPFATGMSASLVLGQADFTHNIANQGAVVGPNTISDAIGAAFDSSGNLWVADSSNNRVLEFVPPFTTNMNANLVLGQADFTHNLANQSATLNAPPTSATLSFPTQVVFDSSGRLFVNDSVNSRTLVFAPPFSTGMNASLVIGQGNFTSAIGATTAVGQNLPLGVFTAPPH